MSYGANFADLFRRSAGYVDKILKGAKPAICRSSNRPSSSWWSTSKRPRPSGSTIPESILLQADEVIR